MIPAPSSSLPCSIFSGALTGNLICLGDHLGLYKALKEAGPATAGQLAASLGFAQRYVAEWLRQQASAKLIRWVEWLEETCRNGNFQNDVKPSGGVRAATWWPSSPAC